MSENTSNSAKLFPHPFSREYWKQARRSSEAAAC